jgi:hypothetical protein
LHTESQTVVLTCLLHSVTHPPECPWGDLLFLPRTSPLLPPSIISHPDNGLGSSRPHLHIFSLHKSQTDPFQTSMKPCHCLKPSPPIKLSQEVPREHLGLLLTPWAISPARPACHAHFPVPGASFSPAALCSGCSTPERLPWLLLFCWD